MANTQISCSHYNENELISRPREILCTKCSILLPEQPRNLARRTHQQQHQPTKDNSGHAGC